MSYYQLIRLYHRASKCLFLCNFAARREPAPWWKPVDCVCGLSKMGDDSLLPALHLRGESHSPLSDDGGTLAYDEQHCR